MNINNASALMSALSHPVRLTVFRLLVQAGSQGLHAGALAEATEISASALTFHLKELHSAALVNSKQDGRYVIYSANFSLMQSLLAYLTENCCAGQACEVEMPDCTVSASTSS